jgi:choline dehydrogenase-like flavoprotein
MNPALNILGVPTAFDPAEDITPGGSFLPSTIHPTNQSRSDARRAYYDPYIYRTNFHVATSQQATRIVTEVGADGNVTITGVEV